RRAAVPDAGADPADQRRVAVRPLRAVGVLRFARISRRRPRIRGRLGRDGGVRGRAHGPRARAHAPVRDDPAPAVTRTAAVCYPMHNLNHPGRDPMRRTTTLVAWVAVLGWVGAPLAALAAEHEQGGKAGEHSNAQWSEDAAKGQERAAEAKAGAKVAPSKAEADAKAKAHKAKHDAKAAAHKTTDDAKAAAGNATGHTKAAAHKATDAAAAKANSAVGGANAKAKGAVDSTLPGMGEGAEVEGGAGAK